MIPHFMPIHKQLRQRPLQRAPRDYWTPKLPSEPTCSDSEDTADPLNPLYSAVSASSSVSMEEEREAAPPGNVAVAFQPLYLLAEYALHETLQQEEETPLNHPGEDLNRENEPSEQVSGICGIMPHNYDPRTSILPESDSVFTNSEPRRPQEPESSSRSKPLPSHPLLETTEAPSRKPRKKPTAKRGRKPKIPTPDLDLTLPPELTSASSISYQPIAPRLKKPRQPRKTRKTPTKRKTKKIPKPAASTKRSAATRKVSADSVAPSGAQPDGQTAQNAQSAKQETRKDTAVSAGPDSRPETSEKSQATGINSSAAGDLKETKAKAVLAEDLPTKDRIDEDITIFADSNSGEEKDVDRDASPSASISSRDAAQPPAKSSDKLPVNDAAPAINAEPVKDGANDLQSAEESKDDSETAKELAPENDVTNNVAEDAQPTEESKDDDSKTAKDVAPADAVSELVAEDVAMNRSPARRVSSSEEQKEQASPKAPSSNGVVSEESEAEASKESREYGKGTKVKKVSAEISHVTFCQYIISLFVSLSHVIF